MNYINQLNLYKIPITVITKRFARKRNFKNWKNDWLPFQWTRPEAQHGFFDTGDRIEAIEKFEGDKMPKAHEDAIKEVGDVPPEIQELLTYKFMRQFENTQEFKAEKVYEKSNSRLGLASAKGKIIDLTYSIRKGRQILREQPNNVRFKQLVSNWRCKRFSYMIHLNRFDREGFLKLIADLEIDEPRFVIGERLSNRVERKKELRKLTKEYCENIMTKRMNALHEKFKVEQLEFEKEKEEFEKWTSQMMQELKIDEESIKID